MKLHNILIAATLVAPGLVFAQQNPPAPAANPEVQKDKEAIKETKEDIQKDRQEIHADVDKIKDLDAQHAAAGKDLNARERAAIDAVRGDKSLSPAQKKDKVNALRRDFNGQRQALNEKFRNDKQALLKDIHKEKKETRKEERKLHEERRELHRDAHKKR